MSRREGTPGDLFWTGFIAGAAIGGALGVLFASELGKRALQHMGAAAGKVQGRYNGRAAAQSDMPGAEAEAAAPGAAETQTHPGGAES